MDGSNHPERGRTAEGDLDPEKIAADLEEWGRKFAEAKAEASLLKKQEPVILSTLKLHYQGLGEPASKAADKARVDPDYAVHIEVMVEARRRQDVAEACWKAAQARFEAMRTAEATRRIEIQTFHGRQR